MHSILKLAQRFLTELKDVLIDLGFPPKCLGCGKELDKGNICDKCFYLVTTNSLGTCVLCGYPKAFNEKCRHPLIRNNNVLLRIRALGKYETPYQNLLHNLKYYECINLGKVLGLGLANLINSDPILSRADFIVPIPLHSARFRERGFNQAEVLAAEASFGSGIEFLNCLKRKKNTKSQITLKHDARIKNVSGAFVVKDDFLKKVKDRRVILVDDVITTGATLQEAAQALVTAQVTEVYAVVVAAAL